MSVRRTFVIIYLVVLFGGIGLLLISGQTTDETFSLPTEGTESFSIEPKEG